MLIRCWGARGSISVSGKEFVKYGGDTACLEIRTRSGDVVIVDTGTGVRRLGNLLLKENQNAFHILFTHAHWDHILGFPFFKPLYKPQTCIEMYGPKHARASIEDVIATIMKPPYFPVKYGDMSAKLNYHDSELKKYSIGSMDIYPIALSHPNEGFGYKFIEGKKTFVYLTDNELTFRHPGGMGYCDYLEFSKKADLLIHDAEFTEEEYQRTKTWGHSTFNEALRLAREAGVKKFGLFHHNQDRSDEAMDGIVKECRKLAGRSIQCFGVKQGMEIEL